MGTTDTHRAARGHRLGRRSRRLPRHGGHGALRAYLSLTQEQVDHIVKKASVAALGQHGPLAVAAVRETGRGVFEDKADRDSTAGPRIDPHRACGQREPDQPVEDRGRPRPPGPSRRRRPSTRAARRAAARRPRTAPRTTPRSPAAGAAARTAAAPRPARGRAATRAAARGARVRRRAARPSRRRARPPGAAAGARRARAGGREQLLHGRGRPDRARRAVRPRSAARPDDPALTEVLIAESRDALAWLHDRACATA